MEPEHLAICADPLSYLVLVSSDRCTAANDLGEAAKVRLRKVLDREETLLREKDAVMGMLFAWREFAANHLARLTPRQRQIMELVLAGYHSKNIAADLGISQRTVENHRAAIMRKTGSKSLPALTRLALAAAWSGAATVSP